MKPFPRSILPFGLSFFSLALLCLIFTTKTGADLVYDFSLNPITWDTSSALPLTFDADDDGVPDFQVAVISGFVDTASGLYTLDNISLPNPPGDSKTFVFAFSSLNPLLPDTEVSLLGFDFYSEKNIEPGGSGGTGAVLADVFDDMGVELVDRINVTGSLNSNPSSVVLPGTLQSLSFELAIDLVMPPKNNDAQVILGDIVFNGGTLRAFTSVPEPGSLLLLLAGSAWLPIRKRRRQV